VGKPKYWGAEGVKSDKSIIGGTCPGYPPKSMPMTDYSTSDVGQPH